MNEKKTLITILIGSYNHEKYIEECLTAILELKLEKKILIIDDGSTDNTVLIINKFISEHNSENIEFIQKANSGLVSSLILGLEKTKTKYLYLIASDDIPKPEGINQVVKYLEKYKNIDFFIGGGENLFENGGKTKIYTKKQKDFFSLDFEKRYIKIFLDRPTILLQSTIFKTDILKKIGGWDIKLIWDDFPMFIKLLTNKDINFIFEPSIETVLYRHHGDNTYKNIEKQYMMTKQTFEKLAPKNLRNKAIGNALGYYVLKAILQFDFRLSLKLFLKSQFYVKLFSLVSIPKIAMNKILKKH